jgi:hypothetical protein
MDITSVFLFLVGDYQSLVLISMIVDMVHHHRVVWFDLCRILAYECVYALRFLFCVGESVW